MGWDFGWREYVPVRERRAKAMLEMQKLRKKGANIQPVVIEGRQIARTFWGKSWCEHLEKFSDFANRLPRGRTYVRNGSVCHLDIKRGAVTAKVSGSEVYDVSINIRALGKPDWKRVRESCAGQVASLLELLQGRLSDHVMTVVTDRDKGLFPKPAEIKMDCSCPDWAGMCKHVAAVMYGVGARFDNKPELLFLLRGVDHEELISKATAKSVVGKTPKQGRRTLDEQKIADVFGIEMAGTTEPAPQPPPAKSKPPRRSKPKLATESQTKRAVGTNSKPIAKVSKRRSRADNQAAAAPDGGSPAQRTSASEKKRVRRKRATGTGSAGDPSSAPPAYQPVATA